MGPLTAFHVNYLDLAYWDPELPQSLCNSRSSVLPAVNMDIFVEISLCKDIGGASRDFYGGIAVIDFLSEPCEHDGRIDLRVFQGGQIGIFIASQNHDYLR
ncbi:MAG: hypothetical protein A4E49_00047 [Methanosaeta sp. PtaU1.Bin112]|nr:MAG: hypothetical protein A4E49_00047 [Methanosaeta sp. PtaU1.Bin112]